MKYGLTEAGRVRACPGNVNPNCTSSSSINQMYAPAWRADESEPGRAAGLLEAVVKRLYPDAQLVKTQSTHELEFRAFSTRGFLGQDIMEFAIRRPRASDRAWEGDEAAPLVTYRSMATQVKYLWPLQAAIGDGDAQRKRLVRIRESLGWPVIGCNYLECFN
eukprot:jgi/Astpho2/1580/fgenesh1_pm.00028_%23_3_t